MFTFDVIELRNHNKIILKTDRESRSGLCLSCGFYCSLETNLLALKRHRMGVRIINFVGSVFN
jgi:hypothetical protein